MSDVPEDVRRAVAQAIGRSIVQSDVSLGPRHDGSRNGWLRAADAAIDALHDAGVLISKVLQGKETDR